MKHFKISLIIASFILLLNACSSKEDLSLIPELTSNSSNTRSMDEASKIASSDFSQILGNSKSRINGESNKNKE